MPQEYSAGAVIFHRAGNTIKYLLLQHTSETQGRPGYWGFPKGHIESGESESLAALREVREETGLRDLALVEGFKASDEYFFKQKCDDGKLETTHKEVAYYLIESKSDQVTLSHEHSDFVWLPYEQARKKLTYKKSKEILEKAYNILRNLPPKS